MKLVQRLALEKVPYRQSKHRGSPPTAHGGSAVSAMKFVDAGGQSRAIRTRTPSFETSETPGASTSAMATAAERIRVGGNGVWRRFFRRAHNSTAVMVLREIGTGDLGGRIPGTSLYPGHAPTPTRSSWISGVLCAMRGVRSMVPSTQGQADLGTRILGKFWWYERSGRRVCAEFWRGWTWPSGTIG